MGSAHVMSQVKGGHIILADQSPPSHIFYAKSNPSRFVHCANNPGESIALLVKEILNTSPYS